MPQRPLFAPSCLLAASLALAAASAWAQGAEAPLPEEPQARAAALKARQEQRDAERRELQARRQAQTARQHKEEAACYRKFAVENCLAEVRQKARTEEKTLRERELQLNDAERREKSAERLHSIEQKRNEPHSPQPMQGGSRQPLNGGPASKRTPDDVEQDRALSEAQAQQRAQQQRKHVESKQRQAAERAQSEAERRATAQELAAERAAESAKRRERRDEAVAGRKGAPLPVPTQLP